MCYEFCEIPGDGKLLKVSLRQKKGTCVIATKPAGATVVLGPKIVGRTPVLIEAGEVEPGEYPFRVLKTGYAPERFRMTISEDQPAYKLIELKRTLGTIEVTYTPAEARLFLDGHDLGVGKAAGENTRKGCKPKNSILIITRYG